MPSEYESLVAALKLTDIPFAEYAWRTRPEGTYGIADGAFVGLTNTIASTRMHHDTVNLYYFASHFAILNRFR